MKQWANHFTRDLRINRKRISCMTVTVIKYVMHSNFCLCKKDKKISSIENPMEEVKADKEHTEYPCLAISIQKG